MLSKLKQLLKTSSSLKLSVIMNFIGSGWSALLGIIFVPIYLHYINIESYGLMGVFASLQMVLSLLDFGLSPTLNRQLAHLSVSKENAQAMHDLKRTLEVPNWICAAIILIILCAMSPLIANYWVRPKEISVGTITQAFLIMSFSVAIQFSLSFYTGGLLGLQKQVLLNTITIISATLRSVGSWVVLAFVSPTIQAFLFWQLLIIALQAVLVAVSLQKSLFYSGNKGKFQKDLLKKIWRFAAGMSLTSVLALILMQSDKFILSWMLNLEDFGYYTLAATIASMVIGVTNVSITNVVYPNYSKYVSLGDEKILISFYHLSCQIMSFFVTPITIFFALFSYQIVLAWTGKEEIAQNTYLLLSFIAIGIGLNGLSILPYHLQLAYGWTRLGLYLVTIAIFTLLPLMILSVYYYGAIGGTFAWIIYNSLYCWTAVFIMHKRILKGEQWKWYFLDILYPLISSLIILGICKYLIPFGQSRFETVMKLGIVLFMGYVGLAILVRTIRDILWVQMRKLTI